MKRTFLLTLSLFFAGCLFSQNNISQTGNDVIYPIEFHITKPLRDIVKDHPFVEQEKEEKESVDRNYRIPQTFLYTAADGPQYGDDPAVRQTTMGTRTIDPTKAIIRNWAGQVATGFRPMDPSGAAGPNHYVQAINGTPFRVHNKTTGANMLTANIGSLWSPATPNDGDPIIMYDKYADRWFVSQFGTTGNRIYIAISTTNDPTGSYYTYTYTSPQFPDYLKFSIWENGYYMTSNQATDKVFCFERSQMLIGNPSARSISANFTTGTVGAFFVPLPADAADGGLPAAGTPLPFFCYTENSWGGGNIDGVKIWNMTVNWTTPSASIALNTTIPCSAFDGTYNASWNDIPQPGTTQKLDGIGGVPTYRAQWRPWTGYNTVLLNWGVLLSATQRSIRWVELRQDQTTGTWSLYQESTYAPDGDSRWVGSIAMDDNGSIGLAYCKSSATTYPTLCYTGRLATDPLGTMSFTETVAVAGTSVQTGTNRFGDYSQTALDPDGITFWHTGEYIAAGVKTRIFSFQLPVSNPLAGVAIALTTGTNPCCAGSSVTFTATPTNGGTNPSYQWKVNGTNVGTNSPTYTTTTLTNGQIVTCVMTSNLSGVTGNPATSNAITMTINPIPATPTASSNSPVCAGSSINLTTPTVTGATYSWTGPNSFTSTTQNPTIASSTTAMAGAYSVTVTSSAGCTSLPGSTTVVVNSGPATPTASSNSPVCVASSINLTTPTVAGASYSWTGPNGFTSTQQNPTISNATALMAGTYTVSVTQGGCPSLGGTTVVAINSTPVVDFTATPTTTNCSGFVQFTDATTGNPTAWSWNFGDGQTSTLQSPSNSYLAAGTYTVTLTATNNCGNNQTVKTNYITINVPTAPTTTGATRCGTGTVALSAAGTGTLNWYTAASGGTLVNTGTNFTTPSLSSTTTYYVESASTSYGTSQFVPSPTITSATTSNTSRYHIFTVTAPIRLVTVQVRTTVAGNRTIELRNSGGTVLQSLTTNIPTGTNNITLNWDIPAGTNYQLGLSATSTVNLFRHNNGVTYPYQIAGLVSITSNSTANSYGFFYNWEVQPITSCSSTRVPVVATINTALPASVSIAATSTTICAGTSVTFTATPTNGGTTPSYQWQVNGTNAGTNSPTFTSTTLANNNVVTCIMTSNGTCVSGSPATSNSVTMTVSSAVTPSVSIAASSSTICSGTSVTFTATPTNGGTPTYQWKLNGANVGTNSPTYTNGALANGNTVSCVMTSGLSCASPTTATSNTVTMTVNPNVVPAVAIAASSTTICAGTSVTFTATPTNGGTPSYQWKLNGANIGTNSATYTNGTLANGDIVTCVMTSTAACTSPATATSNTVTMTVNPSVVPAVAIAASATTICTGTSVTFTATPTNGGTPSYQWKLNGANVGTNSSTYTNGTLANSDVITCVMTSTATCASPATATSNSVTMSVSSAAVPSVVISASSSTICSGTSVTFTATPTNGGTPTYQWTLNGANVGTNSPTYTNGTLANGNTVSCVMTSGLSCASPTTATSNTVTMTVNSNIIPAVAISASSASICNGTSVTFTATPTNGGTPSYQWTINGANTGTNSDTYTNGSLSNGDIVTCVMTSTAACASPTTATSNAVTITVNSTVVPAVTIAASSTTICTGNSVTFTATPTNGGIPSYQWTLNGSNVGTNSDTYTNGTLVNSDVIACTMTSTAACANPLTATSNSVTMTVNPGLTPAVVIAPSSTNICSGETVTFTASAVNGGTPVYQWTLNGANVGTNSSVYSNGTLANSDIIACTITSSLSCVTTPNAISNPITMIVNASVTPAISINATSTSICMGENVTFTATTTNEGTAPTYQWQVNGANVGTNSPTYTISSLYNNDNIVCILTSSETCVTNNNVSSNIVTMTVNSTLPVSSFTYIQNGLDFNFTNTSSGATSYLWNFGDGSTSTLQDPTYTYAIPGMYIVTLTSYNICDSNQIIQSVNAIESGINGNSPTFSVGIYPNPSKGITTVDIKGSETKDAEITIHDAAGRKVFNYHLENAFGNSKVNIDISGYEKGIYYFTVRLDKESQHFQVIRK